MNRKLNAFHVAAEVAVAQHGNGFLPFFLRSGIQHIKVPLSKKRVCLSVCTHNRAKKKKKRNRNVLLSVTARCGNAAQTHRVNGSAHPTSEQDSWNYRFVEMWVPEAPVAHRLHVLEGRREREREEPCLKSGITTVFVQSQAQAWH